MAMAFKRLKTAFALVAFSMLTLSVTVSAQDERFYVYNAANGLADNSAQTIVCTKTGRLVITTMGQINFFDGNNFTFIDPSSENLYPLRNYKGNAHLYFDKHHHLWLKNSGNVTCVNLTTEKFVDSVDEELEKLGIDSQVFDLFADVNNNLWVMTDKGIVNVETGKAYRINKLHALQDMEVYQDKYLLLFYDNSLAEVLDLASGSKVYEGTALPDNQVAGHNSSSLVRVVGNSIFQIRDGSDGGVLMRFDIGKWNWEMVLKTPYYLSNLTERDGLLYVPSAYGYWTYNLSTKKLTHIEELQMESGEKLLTDINAMVFDLQGGLWIGTEKRGLLYSRPSATPFKVYTWNQPYAYHLLDLMDQKVPNPVTTYNGQSVNCVYNDSRGWVWVGTSSGLQVYRDKEDKLPSVYTRKDGLLNNVIHTIIEDGSHNIWVGTSCGICCLVIENDKLRYINRYNSWDKIPEESFENGRSFRMSDGTIVMQMLDHMIEFNPEKMKTVNNGSLFKVSPKLVGLMVNGNVIQTGQELDGNVILEKAPTRTKEINLNYNQNTVSLTFSALNYFRPQQTYYRIKIEGLDNNWRVLTPYNSGGMVDSRGKLHLPLVSLKPGSYTILVQSSMMPDVWDDEPFEWIVNVNEPWWRTTGMVLLMSSLLFLLFLVNVYLYVRNSGMKARRISEEYNVLKRIKQFADFSNSTDSEPLGITYEETMMIGADYNASLSPEFVDVMMKIMSLVGSKKTSELSMQQLSKKAGMKLQPFYALVMNNIYKNPKALQKKLMIQKAEKLLVTSSMDIADIAKACNFSSPNYFIATFYREHHLLPEEFRSTSR